MPATADNLRELHQLHQRAKAIRDRLSSGPKTLAARQIALTNKQAALDAAKKALQDAKVQQKTKEHTVQSVNSKIDDLKGKLNAVKKNEEYKAIQNEIALNKSTVDKIEGTILEDMVKVDELAKALAAEEAEFKKFAAEVAAMKTLIESQAEGQKAQLLELEKAIIEAEEVIPEDFRERFKRTVKQHGAEAMAQVEFDRKSHAGSCSGCFVSVTTQMMNELINGETLTVCMTCGRVLYLSEEDLSVIRR